MHESENTLIKPKKQSEFRGINETRKDSLFDMEGYIMQNKKKIDLANVQYKAKLQNKVRDKNIKVKQPTSVCITLLNICKVCLDNGNDR